MITLGGGLLASWGNTNIYFFSYFYLQGTNITHSTNSFVILSIVLALSFMMIASIKLRKILSFEKLIQLCALVFLLSPLIVQISFNIYTFTIFCLTIPSGVFAVCAIPMINCLWSYYPHALNKMTAAMIVSFCIGGAFWNVIFLHLVNPSNKMALISANDLTFFDPSITDNIEFSTFLVFFTAGCLMLSGSTIIKKNIVSEM